jgi:hypothetical protein
MVENIGGWGGIVFFANSPLVFTNGTYQPTQSLGPNENFKIHSRKKWLE